MDWNMESQESPKNEVENFVSLGVPETFLARLAERGITKPTPVQAQAVPLACAGRDLLIQAQTGSGKTLAYLLPLLDRLIKEGQTSLPGKTFALIVTPTRELTQQVMSVVQMLTSDVTPVVLIGGVPIKLQREALQQDARVVIGTPGRILDCLRQSLVSFRNCRLCVLDEVDEMFSMGFFEDVRAILSRLPSERQGLFCSATISPRVTMLAQSFLNKPETVFVDDQKRDLPPIDHLVYRVGGGVTEKPTLLCDIIETRRPRSAIIFCNTKSDTELVESYLRRRGFDARRMNSDLSQKQRDLVMERIRNDELRLLVATDIAARGLDVEQIELVVNYSIHDEPELYLHRTGRTGRAGRAGTAVSLVGPQDFIAFKRVTQNIEASFSEMALPTDEDVADARLAHMYELLKTQDQGLSPRDRLMASKFLKENVDEDICDDDECIAVIAALQKGFVSNLLAHDTRSLDEELDRAPEPSSGGHRDRGGRSGGGGRGQRSGGGRSGGGHGRDRDGRSGGGGRSSRGGGGRSGRGRR